MPGHRGHQEGARRVHEGALPDARVRDVFLTGAAARAEHYEIAAYTGLIEQARALGERDSVEAAPGEPEAGEGGAQEGRDDLEAHPQGGRLRGAFALQRRARARRARATAARSRGRSLRRPGRSASRVAHGRESVPPVASGWRRSGPIDARSISELEERRSPDPSRGRRRCARHLADRAARRAVVRVPVDDEVGRCMPIGPASRPSRGTPRSARARRRACP